MDMQDEKSKRTPIRKVGLTVFRVRVFSVRTALMLGMVVGLVLHDTYEPILGAIALYGYAGLLAIWLLIRVQTRLMLCGHLVLTAWLALMIQRQAFDFEARNFDSKTNELRAISFALNAYHDDYGRFPPCVVTDDNDKPMYSWRVLLIPYLENQVSSGFDFGEPWDSPANRTLTGRSAGIYGISGTTTCVFAVFGREPQRGLETVWELGKGIRKRSVEVPEWAVIQLIFLPGQEIHWAEPVDLEFSEEFGLINPKTGKRGHALFESVPFFEVCFLNGNVAKLRSDLDLLQFSELLKTKDTGRLHDHSRQENRARIAELKKTHLDALRYVRDRLRWPMGVLLFVGCVLTIAFCVPKQLAKTTCDVNS